MLRSEYLSTVLVNEIVSIYYAKIKVFLKRNLSLNRRYFMRKNSWGHVVLGEVNYNT